MAESRSQVFSEITPAQYAKLVEKVKTAGIEISGNNGRATRMGVEVTWNYSEKNQQLELTCVQTPFFLSADEVNAKLRDLVSETLCS